jgi:hypothetical protein
MAGKLFLRRGPVVYALDDRALPGVDLRRVAVDPSAPPDDADPRAIAVRVRVDDAEPCATPLYRPQRRSAPVGRDAVVAMRPYAEWPEGTGQLRIWLRRAG